MAILELCRELDSLFDKCISDLCILYPDTVIYYEVRVFCITVYF